jgi:excisionase family DNA binding protein
METVTVRTDHTHRSQVLPQLIDIPSLARWLGTSIRHVRRLVAEKRIPYIKVGRLIRFDPAEIRRWIQEHAHEVSA